VVVYKPADATLSLLLPTVLAEAEGPPTWEREKWEREEREKKTFLILGSPSNLSGRGWRESDRFS
jgi:hypothetical protein